MKLENNAVILIGTDGTITNIARPSLAEAQKMVEGYVEMLRFDALLAGNKLVAAQALFNEDGLLKKMPPNVEASVIVGRALVGPVIVLTGARRWR